MIDLSIVIVNWNAMAVLEACLESIKSATHGLTTETIVVDNASSDGSVQLIRDRYPWVSLVASSTNLGFARANNLGIHRCSGRNILLLNPDTICHPESLSKLVAFLDANPDVGAAGPLVLNPDGTLQPSCTRTPTLSRELWRLFHLDRLKAYGVYDMRDWSRSMRREVDALLGACLMVRRTVLESTGGLDEDYFMYTEEVDLCYRIRRAGWGVYWVPSAAIVHLGGQSTRQAAPEMFLWLYRSKLLFFRKHYGRLSAALYKVVLAASSLARLLLGPLTWIENRDRRREHSILLRRYGRLLALLPRM